MRSPTRRRLLGRTALVAGLAGSAGCLGPALPFGREGVPGAVTDLAHAADYRDAGRWPMAGYDGGRTARGETPVPDGDVALAWRRRPGRDPTGAIGPVVGADRVFIAYEDHPEEGEPTARLVAFDARDGTERLDVALGTARTVGLALTDDGLVAVTRDPAFEGAQVRGLDRAGGDGWTDEIPDVTGPPAVVDDTCYLATRADDDAVYAWDADGTRRWRTPVDGDAYTAVCADASGVYVGLADGRVAALTPDGEHRWTRAVATPDDCCPDIQGTPAVADGTLYVPGIAEELVAVDTADGSVRWRRTLVDDDYGNPVPSPAVAGDTVYVTTSHGGTLALAAADGAVRWRSAEDGGLRPPATDGRGVLVPRHDAVLAYDETGRQTWQVDLVVPDVGMAGYVMDPTATLAHGLCYVGLADGRVLALGAADES
jgi:outer membrane protein assembly factor BamB